MSAFLERTLSISSALFQKLCLWALFRPVSGMRASEPSKMATNPKIPMGKSGKYSNIHANWL